MPNTDDTPENTGRRGPTRRKLGRRERSRFLRLLRQGYGVTLARQKMAISARVVRNTEDDCPGFRRRMRDARVAAGQRLELVAYRLARKGDEKILPRMLARLDKARQLKQAARQHRARMDLLDAGFESRAFDQSVVNAVAFYSIVEPFIPIESMPAIQEALRIHIQRLKAPGDPAGGPP